MCKIVNLRKEKYDIYIGRPSVWGNPFVIGRDGNREEVIQKYREYFQKRREDGIISDHALSALNGKVLGCYCKPEDCHGDVIVEAVEAVVSQN